ncbi:hypothetical protein OHA61_30785 [Streptomyces sp. NBC_00885]|uniref:hypothetical protein n=1 Tax=Streptomyces sp. NBC_00885 TaxID=2975857 RepID=UPI00386E4BCF|nr:hypothetical protein OHA61_30785 [Streptomyces sp. NBC_00885]
MANSSDPFEELARFAIGEIDATRNEILKVRRKGDEDTGELDFVLSRAKDVEAWTEKVAARLPDPDSLLSIRLQSRMSSLRNATWSAKSRGEIGVAKWPTPEDAGNILYYCRHDEPTLIAGKCPATPCPGERRR